MKADTAQKSRGFTLVELIIVIIILGILAALAIPQFTSSTTDAKESSLKGNLAVLRTAIGLYYHEHGSIYPGATKATDGSATSSDAEVNTAIQTQLTLYTDKTGKTNATKTAVFAYGPYLTALPTSPVAPAAVTTLLKGKTGAAALVADNTSHYIYCAGTGQIIANSTATDAAAVAYSAY